MWGMETGESLGTGDAGLSEACTKGLSDRAGCLTSSIFLWPPYVYTTRDTCTHVNTYTHRQKQRHTERHRGAGTKGGRKRRDEDPPL